MFLYDLNRVVRCIQVYYSVIYFSFKQGHVVFEGGQRPDDLFFLRQYRQFGEYRFYSMSFVYSGVGTYVRLYGSGLFNCLSWF